MDPLGQLAGSASEASTANAKAALRDGSNLAPRRSRVSLARVKPRVRSRPMIKAFLFDFDGVIVDTEVRAFDRLTSFSIRSRS